MAGLALFSFGPKVVDAALARATGRDDLPKAQLPIMAGVSTAAVGWLLYRTRLPAVKRN